MRLIDDNFDKIRQVDNDVDAQLRRKSSRRSLQEICKLNSNIETHKLHEALDSDLKQLYRQEKMRQRQIQMENMRLPKISNLGADRHSVRFSNQITKGSRMNRDGQTETNSFSKKTSMRALDVNEVNVLATDIQRELQKSQNRTRKARPATANMKKKFNLIAESIQEIESKKSLDRLQDDKLHMMESIEHLLKQNHNWASNQNVQKVAIQEKKPKRPFSAHQTSAANQGTSNEQANLLQMPSDGQVKVKHGSGADETDEERVEIGTAEHEDEKLEQEIRRVEDVEEQSPGGRAHGAED